MKIRLQILVGLALLALASFNAQLSIASAQGVITTNWSTLTNWTETSAPHGSGGVGPYWSSIASSSDGTKLAAVDYGGGIGGGIWTSTNAGLTWIQTSAPSTNWESIASSSDGSKLAAVYGLDLVGKIYTSTNGGLTWIQTSAPSTNWASIASSSDGTKLAAGVGSYSGVSGGIWTSTDAGGTWTQTSAPNETWFSIASSSDGTKLVGVTSYGIYTSTNGGVTWEQGSVPNKPNLAWSSVTSSSNGTKLAAAIDGGGIYTSTNGGVTWTQTGAPNRRYWTGIASSSDGTKLAAGCTAPEEIYVSTNGGVTWTQSSEQSDLTLGPSIASSSDGTKLAAAVFEGGIWTAQATIQTNTPALSIRFTDNSVMVSWPTNGSYTLQQNSNLALPGGWTTSGYPISTTNGINSITVTPAAGTLLFRLTTQP